MLNQKYVKELEKTIEHVLNLTPSFAILLTWDFLIEHES